MKNNKKNSFISLTSTSPPRSCESQYLSQSSIFYLFVGHIQWVGIEKKWIGWKLLERTLKREKGSACEISLTAKCKNIFTSLLTPHEITFIVLTQSLIWIMKTFVQISWDHKTYLWHHHVRVLYARGNFHNNWKIWRDHKFH